MSKVKFTEWEPECIQQQSLTRKSNELKIQGQEIITRWNNEQIIDSNQGETGENFGGKNTTRKFAEKAL